jgi:hypothetical protein
MKEEIEIEMGASDEYVVLCCISIQSGNVGGEL